MESCQTWSARRHTGHWNSQLIWELQAWMFWQARKEGTAYMHIAFTWKYVVGTTVNLPHRHTYYELHIHQCQLQPVSIRLRTVSQYSPGSFWSLLIMLHYGCPHMLKPFLPLSAFVHVLPNPPSHRGDILYGRPLITSSLQDTSLIKLSWRSEENVYVKLLTDRQMLVLTLPPGRVNNHTAKKNRKQN